MLGWILSRRRSTDKRPFVDSYCPQIRTKEEGESNAAYHAYIYPVLVAALFGKNLPRPYQIHFKTSQAGMQ